MNSTFTAVACALCACVGLGTASFFGIGSENNASLQAVTTAPDAPVDAKDMPYAKVNKAADLRFSAIEPKPPAPAISKSSLKQKISRRDDRYVYRSWRVDFTNATEGLLNIYAEIEWLDSDGFQVAYSNGTKIVASGQNFITDVKRFSLAESRKIDTCRITKITSRKAAKPFVQLIGKKDKAMSRDSRNVSRAWRVDIVNLSETRMNCYVEVEWLDVDGHQVGYSNQTKVIGSGKHSLTSKKRFDHFDNRRIHSFNVAKITARPAR